MKKSAVLGYVFFFCVAATALCYVGARWTAPEPKLPIPNLEIRVECLENKVNDLLGDVRRLNGDVRILKDLTLPNWDEIDAEAMAEAKQLAQEQAKR